MIQLRGPQSIDDSEFAPQQFNHCVFAGWPGLLQHCPPSPGVRVAVDNARFTESKRPDGIGQDSDNGQPDTTSNEYAHGARHLLPSLIHPGQYVGE